MLVNELQGGPLAPYDFIHTIRKPQRNAPVSPKQQEDIGIPLRFSISAIKVYPGGIYFLRQNILGFFKKI